MSSIWKGLLQEVDTGDILIFFIKDALEISDLAHLIKYQIVNTLHF